jgi:hypothetical protein
MFRYSQLSRKATRSGLRGYGQCVDAFCTHGRPEPFVFVAGPLEAEAAIPFPEAEWRLHATSSAEIMRRLGECPFQSRNTRAEAKGVWL